VLVVLLGREPLRMAPFRNGGPRPLFWHSRSRPLWNSHLWFFANFVSGDSEIPSPFSYSNTNCSLAHVQFGSTSSLPIEGMCRIHYSGTMLMLQWKPLVKHWSIISCFITVADTIAECWNVLHVRVTISCHKVSVFRTWCMCFADVQTGILQLRMTAFVVATSKMASRMPIQYSFHTTKESCSIIQNPALPRGIIILTNGTDFLGLCVCNLLSFIDHSDNMHITNIFTEKNGFYIFCSHARNVSQTRPMISTQSIHR